MEVVLSVHSVGNGKYRFYIPSKPSREVFEERKRVVIIVINNKEYHTHTTCGPLDWDNLKKNQKKGYDLYSSEISKWITDNRLHLKDSNGKCQKVEFKISNKGDIIILTKN